MHIGLDFFDASINRVAAWVIGTRNALRALLMALLEPVDQLRELEVGGDYTTRLALLEALEDLPFGTVWDYHCLQQGVLVGMRLVDEIRAYEARVLSARAYFLVGGEQRHKPGRCSRCWIVIQREHSGASAVCKASCVKREGANSKRGER